MIEQNNTIKINNTDFIHNGNFDGDIKIVRLEKQITIPFADLLCFFVEYVRFKRMNKLDQASDDEILRI